MGVFTYENTCESSIEPSNSSYLKQDAISPLAMHSYVSSGDYRGSLRAGYPC